MEPENDIVTKGNRAGEVQGRLWFLESMDQVNRAIQDTDDFGQMGHVLDAVLDIFECDRAWITYPCDPESRTCRTVAQRSRAELNDSVLLALDVPMDAEVAHFHGVATASEAAVRFGPGTDNPIPGGIAERFGLQSQMCLAVHPKIGKPYLFGMDQCTRVRNWTEPEQRLFEAIGQRLATLLTSLVLSRDLLESKARLEAAQRVAHVGYWVWDLETNGVIWSDETYRIFGLTSQEGPIDLEKVRESIHPDDRKEVFRIAEEAVRSGERADSEHRVIRPNGEIRVVHSLGDLKKDSSGRAYQMFGTVQDITDRKHTDEALQRMSLSFRESNIRLEEAQRIAHVGHWDWNLETGSLTWSDETYRIYGMAPQERAVDIAMLREMIHPEDRESMFRKAEESIHSGVPADAEHRIVRLNGEVRTVHSRADVRRDGSGRPYEMFGTVQDVTERKRAEQALRRSQFYLSEGERLAHIGSWASNDLGIHWSDDLNIYWSDEVYKIYGLDPKNGTPSLQQFLATIHPQDRASMTETLKAMHEQRRGCDITKRVLRPDGEIRHVRCVGIPVVEDGVFQGFHGTTMDVTEQELLTQELRREQAYLNEAQELTHTGSWACNLVTRQIFHSSDENARLYGFDPSQGPIPFEQYYTTILAEDESRLRVVLEEAIRAGTDYDVEFRIRRTDGAIRFMRGIGHHNPSGEPGDYVGITMDITERELLMQELRREQAYLAEAQSLAHIGSWATNFETGQIHHISDETARLHGFDPKAGPIPLESFYDTLHPDDRSDTLAALQDSIRKGVDYDIQGFRICLPDGTIRFLRTIGHHNPSQEIGEYIGITMDITERKRAEEERERLRQLEADLAHINRVNMMGELAAALAHEIKQPIAASVTSASACLRWLAHEPPDLERARAAAGRIQQEGNRAADIINSLRSFYKAGTPAERQSVDVKDTIREMTALLRTEAVRHGVTIRAESENMPHILADRVQLQQVLMNLMLNAIEAMKDLGGELTIRSGVNSEGQVTVSISDTGIGLPAEGLDLIFDPFHTTKPQGTGMGLTISRSIVESYGGRVWATANQGAGATFHFTLPTGAEAHA